MSVYYIVMCLSGINPPIRYNQAMGIEKWAERIYLEEDFGKNVATTVTGLIGLCVYLASEDVPLAAFITIILFPLTRIVANVLRSKHVEKTKIKDQQAALEALDQVVENLTDQERLVIHEFVKYKSSVISDKYLKMNSVYLPDGAVKSLMERGYLTEETFGPGMYDLKLNIAIFEAGRRRFEE